MRGLPSGRVRALGAVVVAAGLALAGCLGAPAAPAETSPVRLHAAAAPLPHGHHLTADAAFLRAADVVPGCEWASRVLDEGGRVLASPGMPQDCSAAARTAAAGESLSFAAVWDGRDADGAVVEGGAAWEISVVDPHGAAHGRALVPLDL